jgi:hypothetical protein
MRKTAKKRTRITGDDVAAARKKIRETPKRNRWPKYHDIYAGDLLYYNALHNDPELISYNEDRVVVFDKTNEVTVRSVKYEHIGKVEDKKEEVTHTASISFYCVSYNGGEHRILDNRCMGKTVEPCDRISCPYYRKGFIAETLREKKFEADVNPEV